MHLNQIESCRRGITAGGDGGDIRSNTVTDSGDVGSIFPAVSIGGDNYTYEANTIWDPVQVGLRIIGNDNTVRFNGVNRAGTTGIELDLGASGNTVESNTMVESGVVALLLEGGATDNTTAFNSFSCNGDGATTPAVHVLSTAGTDNTVTDSGFEHHTMVPSEVIVNNAGPTTVIADNWFVLCTP